MAELVELPKIPLGIKGWSVEKSSATYELEDGSKAVVPIAVYRIWEAGFVAGVMALKSSLPAPLMTGREE